MFKEFCYIDKNTGDFVQLECYLKEEVGKSDIKGFYDKLYAVKMDSTYSRQSDFGKNHHTGDLKRCFSNIMENEVLCFKEVYKLFDTNEQRKSPRVSILLNEFLGMLDFEEKQRYTADEFGTMVRMANSGMFQEESPKFAQQLESIEYNTKMMNAIEFTPVIKTDAKQLVLAK